MSGRRYASLVVSDASTWLSEGGRNTADDPDDDTSTDDGESPSESGDEQLDIMAQDLLLRRRPDHHEARYASQAMRRTITRLRRRRMAAPAQRFPLRSVDLRFPSKQPTSLASLLDDLFGSDTSGDVTVTKPVPSDPGPEDSAAAPLPRARQLAESLLAASSPRIDPINADRPVSTPWADGQRSDWRGIRRWGRPLDANDLDLNDRRDLRQLLFKELSSGALEVATRQEQVRLITPIFVVRRDGKLRLVHDLRPLNARLRHATVKYMSVRDALARRHKFAAKLDLMSAFKHVQVDEELAAHMCFQINGTVFRWTRLPFGMSWSPTLFTEALDPVVQALRRAGLHVVVYVDDIYVGADSVEELDEAMVRVMSDLSRAGWRIAPDKTYAFACSRIVFLGLIVDLTDWTLRVPPSKAAKLRRLVKEARERQRVPLHLLQRITGLMAFFLLAVPQVGLGWRALLGAQAEAEGLPGRHVWRRGALDDELRFWEEHAETLPDVRPVDPAGRGVTVQTDGSGDGTGAVWWPTGSEAPDLDEWAAGRLGRSGACPDHVSMAAYGLEPDECRESSAVREMLALERWLRSVTTCRRPTTPASATRPAVVDDDSTTTRGPRGTPTTDPDCAANPKNCSPTRTTATTLGDDRDDRTQDRSPERRLPLRTIDPTDPIDSAPSRRAAVFVPASSSACPCLTCSGTHSVHWFSDSTAAVAALGKWRSGSVALTRVLARIFELCVKFRLVIHPAWVSRDLQWLPAADWLSRVVGRRRQAEYTVPAAILESACNHLRVAPEIDVFATRANRRFRRFRSAFPESGSEGPALAGTWRARAAYAFPPFSQLPRLVQHFRSGASGASALLLLAPRRHDAIKDAGDLIRARAPWPRDQHLLQHDMSEAPHPPPQDLCFFLLTRPSTSS